MRIFNPLVASSNLARPTKMYKVRTGRKACVRYVPYEEWKQQRIVDKWATDNQTVGNANYLNFPPPPKQLSNLFWHI